MVQGLERSSFQTSEGPRIQETLFTQGQACVLCTFGWKDVGMHEGGLRAVGGGRWVFVRDNTQVRCACLCGCDCVGTAQLEKWDPSLERGGGLCGMRPKDDAVMMSLVYVRFGLSLVTLHFTVLLMQGRRYIGVCLCSSSVDDDV